MIGQKLAAVSVGAVYSGTVWINQNLFDQYHLSPPTSLAQWTSDCAAFKAHGIGCFVQGVGQTAFNEDTLQAISDDVSPGVWAKAIQGQVPWTDPVIVKALTIGMYNTYFSVILPLAALQIPFCVLLTRNFVNGIPDQLFDAARVDGANAARIFWNIILPLTRPIAAAIVILTLIGAWNDYLLPLVFLQTPATETITMLPSYFVSEFSDDQAKVVAAAVITAIPEIVAYLCLQRLFERGLTAGALK